MPISVQFLQFKGFALAPDDISLGEAETQEVSILRDGRVVSVSLPRKSLSIRLRGIPQVDADPFIQLASANRIGLIMGGATIEDINLGAHVLRKAVLTKATPSSSVLLEGKPLLLELQLEYQSLVFD